MFNIYNHKNRRIFTIIIVIILVIAMVIPIVASLVM